MRKLTYEEVKHFIEFESESGCKLISEEYTGSSAKLKLRCACGREFDTSWSKFKSSNKRQCNICSGSVYDYRYIQEFVENNSDCVLISDRYIKSSEILKFRCSCGKMFETNFDTFRQDKRQCNSCGMARYAYEEIKHFVETNSDCILLSNEYLGSKSKILLKCPCGNKFEVGFYNFRDENKRQCNQCSISQGVYHERFTYEQIKYLIECNSDCKLMSGEYKNSKTKLLLKCKCGEEFETTYNSFRSEGKRQCNKCSGFTNWDYDLAKSFIEQHECKLVSGQYKNKNSILTIECRCGEIINTSLRNFKRSKIKGCEVCKGRINRNYTNIKEYIENKSGSGYKLLSENDGEFNVKRKLEIKCNKGHNYKTDFNHFYSGKRCPYCSMRFLKTTDYFKQEVYDLVGDEYTVVGEYVQAKELIEIHHSICKETFKVSPDSFLRGTRCTVCNESKGETRIRNYLNGKNIYFKKEYTFEGLVGVGGNPLRFDFAIFNNGELIQLIEYDGEFHYKKYYEDQNFEETQIHDERKNQYCKENNIPLLRIPYWEFGNIESILDKELSEYELAQEGVCNE